MQSEVEYWEKDVARFLLMGEDFLSIPKGYVTKTTNGYTVHKLFGEVAENGETIQTTITVSIKNGMIRYAEKYQIEYPKFHRYSGPAHVLMRNGEYRHVSFSLYGDLYNLDEWCEMTNKTKNEKAVLLLKYGSAIVKFDD